MRRAAVWRQDERIRRLGISPAMREIKGLFACPGGSPGGRGGLSRQAEINDIG
jgi:hypothetical protein